MLREKIIINLEPDDKTSQGPSMNTRIQYVDELKGNTLVILKQELICT